jgi:hypothetical protein
LTFGDRLGPISVLSLVGNPIYVPFMPGENTCSSCWLLPVPRCPIIPSLSFACLAPKVHIFCLSEAC